jgi:hypothetical protein
MAQHPRRVIFILTAVRTWHPTYNIQPSNQTPPPSNALFTPLRNTGKLLWIRWWPFGLYEWRRIFDYLGDCKDPNTPAPWICYCSSSVPNTSRRFYKWELGKDPWSMTEANTAYPKRVLGTKNYGTPCADPSHGDFTALYKKESKLQCLLCLQRTLNI